ncbi:hypothetical protein A2U01_0109285, partial [Trifolium medium]|nr:hypothetical protein [Trifolium medium]
SKDSLVDIQTRLQNEGEIEGRMRCVYPLWGSVLFGADGSSGGGRFPSLIVLVDEF